MTEGTKSRGSNGFQQPTPAVIGWPSAALMRVPGTYAAAISAKPITVKSAVRWRVHTGACHSTSGSARAMPKPRTISTSPTSDSTE